VHFALARALFDAPEAADDRQQALVLARQAREEYAQAAVTPAVAEDVAALDAWLAKNA
jgi:hypothetical protein